MRRRPQIEEVEVVEVAYRAACARPATWLTEVIEVARPLFDHGGDVFAYEFDTNRRFERWLERPVIAGGDSPLADAVLRSFAAGPRDLHERLHKRAGAVMIFSELYGQNADHHPSIGPHARPVAVGDMIGVNASDPSGHGVFFCATAVSRITRNSHRARRYELLGAHLAAASRLRRSLASSPLPEAVISSDSKVVHAMGAAKSSLDALARASRNIERARSRRADPESLESWRALVEGRWSLVDIVERDGKRFLFAYPNAPSVRDPRRLTAQERVVAGYVALGHSNKLIAYELGMSVGAVGRYVHCALRKFGVRTRVELVDRFTMLSSGHTSEIELSGERLAVVSADTGSFDERLTKAEQQVASLAARGLSTTRIAHERGATPRTIANQLAAIFKKLGITSRAELRLVQHGLGPAK